ncbi:MAG: hypothetical protein QHJ82_07760 [Verrucomicrobiota bacterium]|nr:hypothetical protein [Verrucomicrobiota bacterium]
MNARFKSRLKVGLQTAEVTECLALYFWERSTFNVQRSTLNVQRTTFNAQRSTFNAQRSTLNVQRSTFNVQRSTFNAQRSTFNAQRSTLNAQRSTFNVQRSTLNVQRTELLLHNECSIQKPPKGGTTNRRGNKVPGTLFLRTLNVQRSTFNVQRCYCRMNAQFKSRLKAGLQTAEVEHGHSLRQPEARLKVQQRSAHQQSQAATRCPSSNFGSGCAGLRNMRA